MLRSRCCCPNACASATAASTLAPMTKTSINSTRSFVNSTSIAKLQMIPKKTKTLAMLTTILLNLINLANTTTTPSTQGSVNVTSITDSNYSKIITTEYENTSYLNTSLTFSSLSLLNGNMGVVKISWISRKIIM